jgi:hypothetical protein
MEVEELLRIGVKMWVEAIFFSWMGSDSHLACCEELSQVV